jgi:glycosyltransferase involved in cell wall biosynthesis
MRIAYIMSRFPKLSETFILNEVLTVTAAGVPVELYPLLRERQTTVHPEVAEWVRKAHFHPFVSLPVIRAHAHFAARQPAAYAGVLREVLRGTWGSTNFFVGALGVFPKAVRFAYEMRASGVTHVHAHFATHPAVAALIIQRLTAIPFSFTAHGSDLHVDRRMLDTKVASAAFVVTVSDFNKEVIVRTCGEPARSRIHVIHCGVDPDYFAPVRPESLDGPFTIICVASFEDVKGHRFLVEACRLLSRRGVDLRCDLVGDGPLRSEVEQQVAVAGLGDHVRFHGGQPRPRVAQLLGAARVAVLASHPTPQGKREGVPVALMEAMAAGLPVVSTAISGIPELVEHEVTGLLVPSGDAAAFADALERLARDAWLREQFGRAGRERVRREFNLRTNTRQLLELFGHRAVSPAQDRDAPPLAAFAAR